MRFYTEPFDLLNHTENSQTVITYVALKIVAQAYNTFILPAILCTVRTSLTSQPTDNQVLMPAKHKAIKPKSQDSQKLIFIKIVSKINSQYYSLRSILAASRSTGVIPVK